MTQSVTMLLPLLYIRERAHLRKYAVMTQGGNQIWELLSVSPESVGTLADAPDTLHGYPLLAI